MLLIFNSSSFILVFIFLQKLNELILKFIYPLMKNKLSMLKHKCNACFILTGSRFGCNAAIVIEPMT